MPPASMKRLRILPAEDNEVNQCVAFYQIRMLGRHVDVAFDGFEALKLCENNEYDAVLMDVHVPELEGYATTAEIRRRERSLEIHPNYCHDQRMRCRKTVRNAWL